MVQRVRGNATGLAISLILSVMALCMIFPFVYVILVSFTSGIAYHPNSLMIWPQKWSVEAYRMIFTGNGFFSSLKSSVFITVIGTPLSVIVSAMLAYMFSRKSLPGNRWMTRLLLFTLIFNPGIIPSYILVKDLGLLNSLWALILPSLSNAWTVLVMRSFYGSIPKDLEDAAAMDGYSDMGLFFRIILPLSKPMLAAFTLFNAVGFWNTYFNAILYINTESKWPLQVFLQQIVLSANTANFLNTGIQQPQLQVPTVVIQMATVVVVTLPVLVVYPFLQKYFAQGVMIGSVKE